MRYDYLGVTANYLTVPVTLYRVTTVDRTLRVTPMAIFGFLMADLLWKLLADTPWTPAGYAAFEHLLSNDKDIKKSMSLKGIRHYPLLALKSCIQALRIGGYAHWNAEIRYWGQWQFTIRQFFFRIMVFFNYCSYYEEAAADARHEVSALTRLTEEFLDAFECPKNKTE